MLSAFRTYRDGVTGQWADVRKSGPGRAVRVPWVAVGVAALTVAAAAVTRPLGGPLAASVVQRLGWSAQLAVDGSPWRVVTAIPLTRDPFMLTSMVVSLLVAVGGLELLSGRRRAALTFAGGAVGGYLGISLIVLLLREVPVVEAAHWAQTIDYGASAGIAACTGAIAVLLRRRLVLAFAAAIIVGGLLVHHQIADWEHAFSFSMAVGLTYLSLRHSNDSCGSTMPEPPNAAQVSDSRS